MTAWIMALSLGLLLLPATSLAQHSSGSASPTRQASSTAPSGKTQAADARKHPHKTSPATSGKAHARPAQKKRDKHGRAVVVDTPTLTGTQPYGQRDEALRWADATAARLDLSAPWVRQQIAQARRLPSIERLVLPAPTPNTKNWAAYRSRFIEPRRIEAGVAFWHRHHAWLSRAEQTYGVPASLIVGIIGVETLYGQHMGNFRVLDALATLAFDFPQAHPRAAERQAFFQSELGHFLRLAERAGIDPTRIRGSYAGAMGMPQFMPSSWRRYAVDFDEDGRIDLFHSVADVIGSVAHYFKAFDWKPGMPTHYPVTLIAGQADMDALLAPDIMPTFSVESFLAKGAQIEGPALQHPGPLALIELRNGDDPPSHVAGTENFYAVTRYNWSSYYAMAVIELGQAVAERVSSRR